MMLSTLFLLQMLGGVMVPVEGNDRGGTATEYSDTVWVETKYQQQVRLDYEQKQCDLEREVSFLREAITALERAKPANRTRTALQSIMWGNPDTILVSARDRDRYLTSIRTYIDSLRDDYERNRCLLNVFAANRKRGPFYIRIGIFKDLLPHLSARCIDSLRVLRLCSPDGEYFCWEDWVWMHVQGRQIYGEADRRPGS